MHYLTKGKLEKMKEELRELKTNERQKIASQLKQAIGYGDLSENAAYSTAKDSQARLEEKILEIEDAIKNHVIIEKNNNGIVQIGSTIKLKNGKEEFKYTIVGSKEADPLNGKISNESPLGIAFLGKKVGDLAEVVTPKGVIKYEIIAIE